LFDRNLYALVDYLEWLVQPFPYKRGPQRWMTANDRRERLFERIEIDLARDPSKQLLKVDA
jgi:hypothetical protein